MLRSEPLQRCILGECRAACCLYGVWADRLEVEDIQQHAKMIAPHLKPAHADPTAWFEALREPDKHSLSGTVIHSKVVEDPTHYGGMACIFLREDYKCGLQVAAELNGLHAWRFKPFYCILHPLDLDEEGNITLDANEALVNEPGSCLRPADASIPLIETFSPELRYLLGEKKFATLKKEQTRQELKEQSLAARKK